MMLTVGDHVTIRLHGLDLTGKLLRSREGVDAVIELDEPVALPSPPFQVTAANGVVKYFFVSKKAQHLIREVP
jgi:hypothetical protein